jgi:hypothetical protein
VKRLLNIVIALICAYAWPWTGWLKDNHFVTEKMRFGILVVVTLVFLIQQAILLAPSPADRSKIEERRKVIELNLSVLVTDYYKQIAGATITPPIRVNLSLPTRIRPFTWRLKIYYFFQSVGTSYSADELGMKFKRREGAIGRAWSDQNMIFFDGASKSFQSPLNTVHPKKMPLVSHIQSVLAVPIVEKDKTIGVLALDSEFPASVTGFDQRNIAALARSHANDLSGLCFFDGVK